MAYRPLKHGIISCRTKQMNVFICVVPSGNLGPPVQKQCHNHHYQGVLMVTSQLAAQSMLCVSLCNHISRGLSLAKATTNGQAN